ncbi:DUF2786 domain-containing protein [Actinomadura nitritigenes]|uniref:DUF2786 domain-containing protein n=1 Tax=Actinomadura nitritigenes TaxID=134602 RepID=UPI003D94633E
MGTENPQLNKIRGLLAKAESTEFPEEAEALRERATALMAKYGIEQAVLAGTADPEANEITDRIIDCYRPWAEEKASFLYRLGEAMGCRAVEIETRSGNGFTRIQLVGYVSDLDRVEMLFTSLLVQLAHAVAVATPPPGQKPRPFRRAFVAGYSSEVVWRVRQAEERAAADAKTTHGTGLEVVLVDRSTRVQNFFDNLFPELGTRSVRRYGNSGLNAGMAAGKRADIGQRRTGSGGRQAISG